MRFVLIVAFLLIGCTYSSRISPPDAGIPLDGARGADGPTEVGPGDAAPDVGLTDVGPADVGTDTGDSGIYASCYFAGNHCSLGEECQADEGGPVCVPVTGAVQNPRSTGTMSVIPWPSGEGSEGSMQFLTADAMNCGDAGNRAMFRFVGVANPEGTFPSFNYCEHDVASLMGASYDELHGAPAVMIHTSAISNDGEPVRLPVGDGIEFPPEPWPTLPPGAFCPPTSGVRIFVRSSGVEWLEAAEGYLDLFPVPNEGEVRWVGIYVGVVWDPDREVQTVVTGTFQSVPSFIWC